MDDAAHRDLKQKIADRQSRLGVIGLGYVGLPLAAAAAKAGFPVVGFDIDSAKVARLNAGDSYIGAVPSETLRKLVDATTFRASADLTELASCDVVVICVPTPLGRHREPDTSFIERTADSIAAVLRRGQLVVLESTSYPGTTTELVRPILERTGLKAERDFFLGFSPEREDPGNASFGTANIPKLVSGDGPLAGDLVELFYGSFVAKVIAVSSPAVAEAAKLTENIFRAVNIALVNELKVVYGAMGIDVWEVIEAAKSKPFGYMPFYPGPGLGGHCIPIDPFYLSWVSKAYDVPTRFIELAGEINVSMPSYVVDKVSRAFDSVLKRSLAGSTVLLIGLSYKRNIADIRESPSLKLMELLEERGATVVFHDPHAEEITGTREYSHFQGRRSIDLTAEAVARCDATLIATDHDMIDYATISKHARLIVDTRNAIASRGLPLDNVVKA